MVGPELKRGAKGGNPAAAASGRPGLLCSDILSSVWDFLELCDLFLAGQVCAEWRDCHRQGPRYWCRNTLATAWIRVCGNGYLGVARWLGPRGAGALFSRTWITSALAGAIWKGQLETVKWLVAEYGLGADDVCARYSEGLHGAIKNDHHEVVRSLTEMFGRGVKAEVRRLCAYYQKAQPWCVECLNKKPLGREYRCIDCYMRILGHYSCPYN